MFCRGTNHELLGANYELLGANYGLPGAKKNLLTDISTGVLVKIPLQYHFVEWSSSSSLTSNL